MSATPPRALPQPLRLFLLVLVTLACASLLDAAVGYHLRGRSALDFLWPPQPAVDFYIYNQRVPFLHSAAFFTGPAFPWMYPAPSIFVYLPFYGGIRDTHWWPNYLRFALTAASLAVVLAYALLRAMVHCGLSRQAAMLTLVAVMGLGWPFYFAFERGNIELLLWVGIACGVVCSLRGRYLLAALLLGVFGSAKLYPLLLLGLFAQPKRVRYLVLGVGAALLTTLLALRFLEPDIADAYRRISAGVKLWTALTTLQYWQGGVGPDHSVFGLLRETTAGEILRVPHVLYGFLFLAGLLAGALFLLRVRRLPTVNQVLFLVCAAILLPPTSFDYTLLLLLIPWALIALLCVQAQQGEDNYGRLQKSMLLFGVALAPMTFLHTYTGVPHYFEGPVRCFALLGLAAMAAAKPLEPSLGEVMPFRSVGRPGLKSSPESPHGNARDS